MDVSEPSRQLITESGARIQSWFNGMVETMTSVRQAMYTNDGELVWILPAAWWADLPESVHPVMIFGHKVVLADVDDPMLAIPAKQRLGRRGRRMTSKWKWAASIAALVGAVCLGSCATATSDTGGPKDVRVQEYRTNLRSCLVFTHDTAYGASIAVDCR